MGETRATTMNDNNTPFSTHFNLTNTLWYDASQHNGEPARRSSCPRRSCCSSKRPFFTTSMLVECRFDFHRVPWETWPFGTSQIPPLLDWVVHWFEFLKWNVEQWDQCWDRFYIPTPIPYPMAIHLLDESWVSLFGMLPRGRIKEWERQPPDPHAISITMWLLFWMETWVQCGSAQDPCFLPSVRRPVPCWVPLEAMQLQIQPHGHSSLYPVPTPLSAIPVIQSIHPNIVPLVELARIQIATTMRTAPWLIERLDALG